MSANYIRLPRAAALSTLLLLGGAVSMSLAQSLRGEPAAAQTVGAEAVSPAVTSLMKERLSLLKEVEAQTEAHHQIGQATSEELLSAKRAVLDARLALATSNPERITLLKETLSLQKEAEETAKARHRAGVVTSRDVLPFTLARLEAQIALERAKGTEK